MPNQPWDRLPNEPALWFDRFSHFRQLGPARTIEAVHRAAGRPARGASRPAAGQSRPSPKAGGKWHRVAAQWRWRERAAAWDDYSRRQHDAFAHERRRSAHESRLAIVQELLDNSFALLRRAGLDHMDARAARDLIPSIRMLLRDLLAAERAELSAANLPALPDPPAEPEQPQFTVDNYARQERQLRASIIQTILEERIDNYSTVHTYRQANTLSEMLRLLGHPDYVGRRRGLWGDRYSPVIGRPRRAGPAHPEVKPPFYTEYWPAAPTPPPAPGAADAANPADTANAANPADADGAAAAPADDYNEPIAPRRYYGNDETLGDLELEEDDARGAPPAYAPPAVSPRFFRFYFPDGIDNFYDDI